MNNIYHRETGYLSLSFITMMMVFVLLVFTLMKHHKSITHSIRKQTLSIEAERMAFQQLDSYPTRLPYDHCTWLVEIEEQQGNWINVKVKHRVFGYHTQQKRINPTRVNSDR